MVRTLKKEPRSVAIVEDIVTAALLIVAVTLASSDFTMAGKMIRFCSTFAVGFVLCTLNSFVYGRLCMRRVRLDGGYQQ